MNKLTKMSKKNILESVKKENGMFSLTTLWKISGGDPQKAPAKWQETEMAIGFISATSRILNIAKNDIIKSKRGKGGGTEAHRQIALEYAQYLDQSLAVLVNEVFFERVEEEKNPDLIVDRAISTYQRKGYSADWISKRISGKGTRNEFTTTLSKHGVMGDGYQRCTNAMYIELYGKDAKGVREKKGIPQKANIRENMSSVELQAIQFAEALAKDDIEKNRRYGNEECALVSNHAARVVKNSINQFRNR